MEIHSNKTFDQLLEDLASTDYGTMISAVKLLQAMGTERIIEPLIQLLYSSIENKQYPILRSLGYALGGLNDPRIIEPLFYAFAIYEANGCYGSSIFMGALYHMGEPALQLVIKASKSENPDISKAAWRIIGHFLFVFSMRETLVSPRVPLLLLDAPHSSYRIKALEALEKFDSDEVRDSVIKELKINNRYTRVMALNTLAKIGNAETLLDVVPFAEMDRGRYHINDATIEAAKQTIAVIKQRFNLT